MENYYKEIIKDFIKEEVESYFNTLEKTEEQSDIIQTLIDEYFSENELAFKEEEDIKQKYNLKENKTHVYRNRDKYESKENKCLARIWNCGMGGQCSNKAVIDGFCKKHCEPKTGPGKYDWWLGTIDKERPVRPINHKGKVHIWAN